jgi:hypothetical protein
VGRGSSVGITTSYGLDGPRIEFRWGEIFRARPYRPWGPPILLYSGYRVFPGVKDVKVRLQLCSVTHRDEPEGLNKAGGRHVVCDVKRVDMLGDFIISPFSDVFFRG